MMDWASIAQLGVGFASLTVLAITLKLAFGYIERKDKQMIEALGKLSDAVQSQARATANQSTAIDSLKDLVRAIYTK